MVRPRAPSSVAAAAPVLVLSLEALLAHSHPPDAVATAIGKVGSCVKRNEGGH